MDRRRSPFRNPLMSQYLILYNLVSALLWVAVLGRVILLVPLVGFRGVYGGVGEFTKWTQTAAVMEILHSASGWWSLLLFFSFGGEGVFAACSLLQKMDF